MLLKHPSVHAQSLSQLRRYSSVHSLSKPQNSKLTSKDSSSSFNKPKRSVEFIPFFHQRNLGRLISKQLKSTSKKQKKDSVEGLLDVINSRNFRKLYTMQRRNEQVKYASKIRSSGQKNLIDPKEWVVNDARKMVNDGRKKAISSIQKHPSLHNLNPSMDQTYQLQSTLRKCCLGTQKNQSNSVITGQKLKSFSKIDLQLYKKMAVNRPPTESNNQLNTLYEHYVGACELNENQRRLFLTRRAK